MSKIWETISAAPAEAWVGLIGVIFGALLASFTAWLTSRASLKQLKMQLEHEESLHRQRLSKERLEELYILVNDWGAVIYLYIEGLIKFARSEVTFEQFAEHVASPTMPKSDLGRLEMIAGIYGGAFEAAFNTSMSIKNKLSQTDVGLFRVADEGKPTGDFVLELTTLQSSFIDSINAFKSEIVKAAKDV